MKRFKTPDIKDLRDGIPSHLFLKNIGLCIVCVFVALCYISVRYDCVTAMEIIATKKRQIEVVRTDVQRERSRYMTATCERSMQHMVDSLGLGLSIQERPPYRINNTTSNP